MQSEVELAGSDLEADALSNCDLMSRRHKLVNGCENTCSAREYAEKGLLGGVESTVAPYYQRRLGYDNRFSLGGSEGTGKSLPSLPTDYKMQLANVMHLHA